MRIKITLELDKPNQLIPINYQYELSSWIYRVIQIADKSYSERLHSEGVRHADKKAFKHFTFSNLSIPKFEIKGDRIEIQSRTVSLILSCYQDSTAKNFMIGLFQAQKITLGDQYSQAFLTVKQIEALPDLPTERETLSFKATSPIVVGRDNDLGHYDYLSPDDPDFKDLLINNLFDKYISLGKSINPEWASRAIQLDILSNKPIKRKKVTIKANTREQTEIVGYLFNFELTAPSELLELGYLSGFGRYNAQGFGASEIIN